MRVIPVIDLMGGVVVRAQGGARATYRPIQTPLAAGAQAGDVVAGFLRLHPFEEVYVADLDAIEGRGDHDALVGDLAARFPAASFWVDRGAGSLPQAQQWLARNAGHLVIGSESQRDLALLAALREHPRIALSLDFRGDAFLGPPGLLASPALWPRRVIAMTLARVGGGGGPDLARLGRVIAAAGGREVIAAGGLRDSGDLRALAQAGAAGVLVASALHDGRLGAAELASHGPSA